MARRKNQFTAPHSSSGSRGGSGGITTPGGASGQAIVPQCFCWVDPNTQEVVDFIGYAIIASDGSFEGWQAIAGTLPPDGAMVNCYSKKIHDALTAPPEPTTICGNTLIDCDGEAQNLICTNCYC